MAALLFKTIAIVSIAGGLLLRTQGFPEGDSLTKIGMAIIMVVIAVSLVKIPRNSRGTY